MNDFTMTVNDASETVIINSDPPRKTAPAAPPVPAINTDKEKED